MVNRTGSLAAAARAAFIRRLGCLLIGGPGLLIGPGALAAEPEPHAPTAAEIVQVVEIGSLSASPDGRRVAFRTEQARLDTDTHELVWRVADIGTGAIREVGGGGAPLYTDPGVIAPEPPLWSPASDAIFFRALIDGRIGIWRAPVSGEGATLVYASESDVEALRLENGHGRLVIGPARDLVRAAERAEYDSGILVDASVQLNQNLVRSGFVNGRLATQRMRGQWFTRVGLLWDLPRRERELDLATLQIGPETPAPPLPALPQLGVDPGLTVRAESGETVHALRENGVTRVRVLAHDNIAAIDCTASVCRDRIVAMAWRPGTGEVLLTVQDLHHRHSLHLWNPATGRARLVVAGEGYFSGGHEGQVPCAVTHDAAICVSASAVSPPRLERIDLENGARTILFDPNAELRRAAMPRVEHLEWTAPEGDRFTGILLFPPGAPAAHLPLFINYYLCGGFLSGGVGEELPFLPLVASGMAVACVNLPPSNGVEDFLGRYPQGLRAVRSLVRILDRRGLIDPGKVGMAGLSFGSEVTMWTLFNSNLLAAAAIASSQIEPTYYWFNSVRGRSQPDVLRRFWELGAPDETPEAWRRRTAAANVARIHAPLLMQLPEQEARNVIELYARLSRTPIPTELYVFPDSAHIKVQPRQRLAAHQRYLDWFRFWLQGAVDPDPAKADQYRRWTDLRARRQAGSAAP